VPAVVLLELTFDCVADCVPATWKDASFLAAFTAIFLLLPFLPMLLNCDEGAQVFL
jgi:hypothetical protein